jgi:hypothetical protein
MSLTRPGRTRQLWRRRLDRIPAVRSTGGDVRGASPWRGLRIAFYSNPLCERGSEIARFDYADYAEKLYGMESYILYDGQSKDNVEIAVAKFAARFRDRVLPLGASTGREIGRCLEAHAIAHAYIIKFGHPDEPCAQPPASPPLHAHAHPSPSAHPPTPARLGAAQRTSLDTHPTPTAAPILTLP